jgi:hypothetical protein
MNACAAEALFVDDFAPLFLQSESIEKDQPRLEEECLSERRRDRPTVSDHDDRVLYSFYGLPALVDGAQHSTTTQPLSEEIREDNECRRNSCACRS